MFGAALNIATAVCMKRALDAAWRAQAEHNEREAENSLATKAKWVRKDYFIHNHTTVDTYEHESGVTLKITKHAS